VWLTEELKRTNTFLAEVGGQRENRSKEVPKQLPSQNPVRKYETLCQVVIY
jgi:hypothetical protein